MLTVPKLDLPDLPGSPTHRELLRARGAPVRIATANWPGYGCGSAPAGAPAGSPDALPAVEAWLAHSGSRLHLLFEVWEDCVRAANDRDQDPVWQDSCVELFIKPEGAPEGYYNFEFNCLGRCLAAFGPDRHERNPAGAATLAGVLRAGEPWTETFGLKPGVQRWSLAVSIPAAALTRHGIGSWNGRTMACNLYKCGDALPRPHYLSLFPITSAQPDFHRPECFGALRFAD
jgi:hypothetical protein